jgi:uncharacterized membrane protein YqjE
MRFWLVMSALLIANAIHPNQKFDSPIIMTGAILIIGSIGLVFDLYELYKDK